MNVIDSNRAIRSYTVSALFEVEMVLHELQAYANPFSLEFEQLQKQWQAQWQDVIQTDLEQAFLKAQILRQEASHLMATYRQVHQVSC